MARSDPAPYVPPELLDPCVDAQHRPFLSVEHAVDVGCTVRAHVVMNTMTIDRRWIPRLHAAGLLHVARLVEGDLVRSSVRATDRMTRFQFDYPLLLALVDRWRPETHTFHLPVGEMTPSVDAS